MSGYRGEQKFRAHTNFDNTNYQKPHNSDNIFIWRYPDNYVRSIVGDVDYLAKVYDVKYLNKMVMENYGDKLGGEVHPVSYFCKYLYNPFWHRISKKGSQFEL